VTARPSPRRPLRLDAEIEPTEQLRIAILQSGAGDKFNVGIPRSAPRDEAAKRHSPAQVCLRDHEVQNPGSRQRGLGNRRGLVDRVLPVPPVQLCWPPAYG
jgi:hypothetical protein